MLSKKRRIIIARSKEMNSFMRTKLRLREARAKKALSGNTRGDRSKIRGGSS